MVELSLTAAVAELDSLSEDVRCRLIDGPRRPLELGKAERSARRRRRHDRLLWGPTA